MGVGQDNGVVQKQRNKSWGPWKHRGVVRVKSKEMHMQEHVGNILRLHKHA
jgi:hypothetical protein